MNSNTSKISCKRGFTRNCHAELVSASCRSIKGFTLIELLVVVLIIGILAAVAVPQYQKAVQKARLSEVATTMSTLSKAVGVWILENGYPSSTTYFTGTKKKAELDITFPCSSETDIGCNTKLGNWWAVCYDEFCQLGIHTDYHADGARGNNWLDGRRIELSGQNGIWSVSYMDSPNAEMCRWANDLYGITGETVYDCSAYL